MPFHQELMVNVKLTSLQKITRFGYSSQQLGQLASPLRITQSGPSPLNNELYYPIESTTCIDKLPLTVLYALTETLLVLKLSMSSLSIFTKFSIAFYTGTDG